MKVSARVLSAEMRQLKKLTALYWAQLHLKEARALCDLGLSLPKDRRSKDVIFGLWTGIVIAYARSFTANLGVSALDRKFSRFASRHNQNLHDRLIEMRKHLHAHKDLLWEEAAVANMGRTNAPVSRVMLTVLEDGETEWEVQRPEFPDTYFTDVKQLCDVQTGRLKEESDGMLKHLLGAEPVTPGNYDLARLIRERRESNPNVA